MDYLLLELDVDQVRLGPVRLPVGIFSPIAQELHTVAWLGARDCPNGQLANLAAAAAVWKGACHKHWRSCKKLAIRHTQNVVVVLTTLTLNTL